MARTFNILLRLNDRLCSQITLLAKRNNMSRNRFLNYIIEIGLNKYLKDYEKF